MEYAYTISTTGSSGNVTWPVVASGGNGAYVYGSGGGGGCGAPAPRPQTALEWLDAEIEATCRLARAASCP